MDVVLLVLVWMLLGLVAGALALAARLGFAAWRLAGQWAVVVALGLGMAAAVVGGALGWLIFGRFFATPAALWVAVLAVVLAPWAVAWARSRGADAGEPHG
jgi:hypothetical protein